MGLAGAGCSTGMQMCQGARRPIFRYCCSHVQRFSLEPLHSCSFLGKSFLAICQLLSQVLELLVLQQPYRLVFPYPVKGYLYFVLKYIYSNL